MKKWTFGKHLLLSVVITLLVRFVPEAIARLMLKRSTRDASSIGIIGGADGPTTIYIGSTSLTHSYRWMLLLPVLLALYLPIWLLTRAKNQE